MKRYFLILLLIIPIYASSQTEWKTHYYRCFGNNKILTLPVDFTFPKYFEYESCSIASFSSPDTCVVSVLCGDAGELKIDSSYHAINMMDLGDVKRIIYYSKILDRYARIDYFAEYQIMYDGATETRKTVLDMIFDRLVQQP